MSASFLGTVLVLSCSPMIPLFGVILYRRWYCRRLRAAQSRRMTSTTTRAGNQGNDQQEKTTTTTKTTTTMVLAFFHPYCAGGGGGERVLWKALQVLGDLVDTYPLLQVIVYTIDPPSQHYQTDLLQNVKERFSITISDKLKLSFVHLHQHKHLLQPSPRLSLLVESFNGMRLAWYALSLSSLLPEQQQYPNQSQSQPPQQPMLPHVFVDTTGAAFTFIPAALWYGCKIVAYVHYPTISTDMLRLVWERRRATYNHATEIAQSRIQTTIKLVYYIAFAILYGMVGSLATCVMVNSTWTCRHIQFLWRGAAWRDVIRVVYPPCAVSDLSSTDRIGVDATTTNTTIQRQPVIVSIGQFRPEKDHILQLESVAKLLQQHTELKTSVKLVLIGSCRNNEDEQRLAHLQQLAKDLDLTTHNNVEFCVNQPYSTIQHWLARASVGIHTMWNEHFGIGIVEMMAAGLLVVAHNSGGPQSDIIIPRQTGFLASTVDEYADALYEALTMGSQNRAETMRRAAQTSSQRFSDQVFAESFRETLLAAKIF